MKFRAPQEAGPESMRLRADKEWVGIGARGLVNIINRGKGHADAQSSKNT